MPIYLPAPEVNCSKGLPKLSIYKIPMGSDSEASITIKNINEQNIFVPNEPMDTQEIKLPNQVK